MQQSSEPGDDRPILLHLEGASTSKVQGSLPGWHEAPIALRRAGWGAGAGDARGGWGGGGWAAPGRRGDRCARAAHRDDAVTNPLIVRRLPGRGLVRGHSQKVRWSHVQRGLLAQDGSGGRLGAGWGSAARRGGPGVQVRCRTPVTPPNPPNRSWQWFGLGSSSLSLACCRGLVLVHFTVGLLEVLLLEVRGLGLEVVDAAMEHPRRHSTSFPPPPLRRRSSSTCTLSVKACSLSLGRGWTGAAGPRPHGQGPPSGQSARHRPLTLRSPGLSGYLAASSFLYTPSSLPADGGGGGEGGGETSLSLSAAHAPPGPALARRSPARGPPASTDVQL